MEKRYVQLGQIEKIIEHSAKKSKPVLIYEYKLKDTKSKYFYQIERKMAFIEGGTVEYGILRETGVEESDDKTQEAMRLLKEQGYKIIRQ